MRSTFRDDARKPGQDAPLTTESFSHLLDALSAEYRSSLPERLAEIDHLWRDLQSGVLQASHIADLQRALHTIAGSAKTFGVGDVGEAAALAESYLEPFCAQGTLPGPAGRTEVTRLLEALKRPAGER
jgi:chemotaxis protein histidine kinase CheA